MKPRVFLFLLLALGMALAGCSSGDDASPTTAGSQQQPGDGNGGGGQDGDDGGTSGPSESGDLPDSVPDDFEIPFPSGWEIDVHDEIGLVSSGTQLLYAEDRYDEIVAFYDDWTESRSEEYAKTVAGDTVAFTRMDGTIWLITVSKDEQRDQKWTLLQVTGGSAEAN